MKYFIIAIRFIVTALFVVAAIQELFFPELTTPFSWLEWAFLTACLYIIWT